MHIVHVTHRAWPVVGGSERYVREIARRQVLEGHRVTVLATDARDLSALWDGTGRTVGSEVAGEVDGVRIRRLPVRHLPAGSAVFPALRRLAWLLSKCSARATFPLTRFTPWVPELAQALSEEQGDLLCAWNITLEGLTAAVARDARLRCVPWVGVPILHLARPRFYTMPHQLMLLREAAAVVTLTATERAFLVEHGFDREAVYVVSPGVNLVEGRWADGQRFRDKHRISGPLVLTLASLCFDKGTSHLLEAARVLWREGSSLTLVLVGAQDRSVRRALARVPGPQRANLRCLEEVTEDEKWDAIDAADVVALPSRTEAFGIVYLEAWVRGKPVIGARAGAIPDVIDDGADGLLVPFGEIVALANALRDLLDDPGLRAQLGSRGREKVTASYQWDQQYARMKAVVERVMEGRVCPDGKTV